MALTAAEKQKRYREKLKKNPEKYEEAKRKHRELYHKTKKLVKDLTTKEKQNLMATTPPSSPVSSLHDILVEQHQQTPPASPVVDSAKVRGRKKVRKDRKCVFALSSRGRPIMKVGRYRFNRWGGSKGALTRWICEKDHQGCRARMTTSGDEIVKSLAKHNH
ncbi:unnamed protein product [Colias eurytheme]|nr:unnamed protein product [Colias eurytheme]